MPVRGAGTGASWRCPSSKERLKITGVQASEIRYDILGVNAMHRDRPATPIRTV
jgi:hypothetical protein